MQNWSMKNVLIIGAARQGLALARFLTVKGAKVTLNDIRPPEKLQASMEAMRGYEVNWQLGHHSLELLSGIDQICVSGGVPLSLPLLQEAKKRGIPLTNDSQIFMENVSARVIGITGSAGKTTTTTLVGRMADHEFTNLRSSWVGGNIGIPLIDVVDQIQEEDLVVLEFSSFQLELMHRSPQIGAILNITPNHLDRHGTMEAYTAIKSRIYQFQQPEDWTILGCEDPIAWALRQEVPGKLAAFGRNRIADIPSSFLENDAIMVFDGKNTTEIIPTSDINLKGAHNLLNVLAACSIAQAAGLSPESMRSGIVGFGGVPHRLEFVRSYHGADWYNGSKATTPESAIVAFQSFTEPKIVLLGGRDKKLPWDRLASLALKEIDHIITFGEASPVILDALHSAKQNTTTNGREATIDSCPSLYAAVQLAADMAQQGDIVLLAPGGTSFDEFNNYEERGEKYKEWVNKLT